MVQRKKIAFLFPGQGAQSVGMGKDFVQSYSEALRVFQEGDEVLKRPLSKIVFEGPPELLTETRNSQTAIFLTSAAILAVLNRQFPALKPNVCAGLSLGEYTALYASKKLEFETTLQLIQYRGEWMNKACEMHVGTMAAIFGLSAEQVEEMVQEVGQDLRMPNELWVANFNCPGQTVISGTLKGVEEGCKAAQSRGAKRTIALQVHGAFHSGLMQLAQEKLAEKIEALTFAETDIDLVMNVPGKCVRDSALIRQFLIAQVTSPVRWEQSMQSLSDVDLFVEIGCGKVLTGLNRQMGLIAPTINVSKVADLEVLAKALE